MERFRVFGHALRVAMVDAGMTQQEVADAAGLSLATVSKHVRGITQPTLPQLEQYSRVLGVRWVVAPATGFEPVTYRSTTSTAGAA